MPHQVADTVGGVVSNRTTEKERQPVPDPPPVSHVTSKIPALDNSLLPATPAPSTDNPIPVANDPTPVANDPTPVANDSTPVANDPTPSANDPTPSVNDLTLVVHDPIHLTGSPHCGVFALDEPSAFITPEAIKYLETVPGGKHWIDMVKVFLLFEQQPAQKDVSISPPTHSVIRANNLD